MQNSRTETKCTVRGYHLHGFLKRRMFLNAFFLIQFGYCPLVWMFQSRSKNNKINRLHERCLRIIYNSDKKSTLIELLKNDNSFSTHKQNLRFLAIEMFRFKRGLACALLKKMIPQNRQNR